jgi:cytochrome c biogenesis protein
MWKILNSRKLAFWLLFIFLSLLLLSAFIPSYYTLSDKELHDLEQGSPYFYWVISHFSTPFLIRNPVFTVASFLLFLSTLVCTADRVRLWTASRKSEFSKEKSFSFSVTETAQEDTAVLRERIGRLLSRGRWERGSEQTEQAVVLTGQKGVSGFWGSIVFHVGLLFCFLAGPASALTGYRGELVLLENEKISLRSVAGVEKAPASLPDAEITVHDLRGEFFKGRYRQDFGGMMTVNTGTERQELAFAVNSPVSYRGYQFSLQEFGYAPRLVIGWPGSEKFDSFLKVSVDEEKDTFNLGGGVRALVLFFPDFFREGGKIGSRSRMPVNPVTMVKLFRGEKEVYKGLFRPGDEAVWEGNRVGVPEYKRWVNLAVTGEMGINLVIIGTLLVVAGLFVRFVSNERRIEFELVPAPEGTKLKVRGYSRYYPAFLEKEVLEMASKIIAGEG